MHPEVPIELRLHSSGQYYTLGLARLGMERDMTLEAELTRALAQDMQLRGRN